LAGFWRPNPELKPSVGRAGRQDVRDFTGEGGQTGSASTSPRSLRSSEKQRTRESGEAGKIPDLSNKNLGVRMEMTAGDAMSMNQRLVHFGLLQPFEKAAQAGDWVAMVAVLVKAQVPEPQAWQAAREIAEHPERLTH
jgi:hypothetical protein